MSSSIIQRSRIFRNLFRQERVKFVYYGRNDSQLWQRVIQECRSTRKPSSQQMTNSIRAIQQAIYFPGQTTAASFIAVTTQHLLLLHRLMTILPELLKPAIPNFTTRLFELMAPCLSLLELYTPIPWQFGFRTTLRGKSEMLTVQDTSAHSKVLWYYHDPGNAPALY